MPASDDLVDPDILVLSFLPAAAWLDNYFEAHLMSALAAGIIPLT